MTTRLIRTERTAIATVKVYRDTELLQYIVKPFDNATGKAQPERTWYFTDDQNDAFATARHMSNYVPPLKPTTTRINKALKKAGRAERLIRGRGYYYLHGGEAAIFPSTMVLCYRLDATDEDFLYAAREVNGLFTAAGHAAPLASVIAETEDLTPPWKRGRSQR